MSKKVTPPRLVLGFFRWFCNPDYAEDIEGDLLERFEKRKGNRHPARWLFFLDVLKLFRPSLIKIFHDSNPSDPIGMFSHHIKISRRSIARNKIFSSINIIGLSISMAVGLVVISFLNEIYSYDNFHEKRDRIYRIVNQYGETGQEAQNYATASYKAGQMLENQYSGYENIVYIEKGLKGDLAKDESDAVLVEKGFYASADFFKVFSFELLQGNPNIVLSRPNTIVLTASLASKLFKEQEAIGSLVRMKGKQFTVTGIVADPPKNSHIQFNAIGSFATVLEDNKEDSYFHDWENIWNTYVYLLLPDDKNYKPLFSNLREIGKAENAKVSHYQIELGLQSMGEIFPSERRYNQLGIFMRLETVRWFSILAIVIILSACFNYANLSIARTLKKVKEVGIRKVIGAGRLQLMMQFLSEAVMISLIALSIASVLFVLIRPEFLSMNRDIERTVTLAINTKIVVLFILFAVVVGVVAGLVPAWIISKTKLLDVLKGISVSKSKSRFHPKKLLLGFQFSLSIAFTILVIASFRQYQFALNFDLGFDTTNILNVEVQKNDPDVIQTEFEQLPDVVSVSKSNYVPSIGGLFADYAKYEDRSDSSLVFNLQIDENYIENFDHQLLAGGNFEVDNNLKSVIVNEEFLKRFNISSPDNAIGESIIFSRRPHTIVGVVQNFHYGTLETDIKPFAFVKSDRVRFVNLKINSANILQTMDRLKAEWTKIDKVHPFKAFFYEDQIERAYRKLSTMLKSLGLLSVIAVSVSILGLLGMAVFDTESRMKEIAIRKVLGASITNLFTLLSTHFVVLFLIGIAIALPSAYLIFNELIVGKALYQTELDIIEIASGVLGILVLAVITISSQTIKGASSNPVENLRNE